MGLQLGLAKHIPASLPVTHTSLVGRRDDARQVAHLLRSGTCRLITITGPGGIGKTRLAIHVASHLAADFPDGVFWIPLAAVSSATQVLPIILQHLGVHEANDIAPVDRLLEAVQHRKMLLVLDNMEHLLACAPDISTVATASEDLVLLATSQAPLGVGGEQVHALRPLALPDPKTPADRQLQSDAVSLFVQRAYATNPYLDISGDDAATIAAICTRLDGLPLAIELAAARSNVLNPSALLSRLDHSLSVLTSNRRDVADRLRTQRNAIAWSYELLSAEEQRFFRWLSVFAGGIPLAAIDSFPPMTDHDTFALDLLTQLVERSLVGVSMLPEQDPRYAMLEILREFGHDQLRAVGDDTAARTWHAEWVARLAIETGAHLLDDGQVRAMKTFSQAIENIRLALRWFLQHGPPEQALAICGAISRFWSMRGMATEGRDWIAEALAATPEEPTSLRAETLYAEGCLAADQNDLSGAERAFAASLAVAERAGDPVAMSAALSGLGTVAHDRNDYERALTWHERALDAANVSGDPRSRSVALGNMGVAFFYRGEYEAARACWEEVAPVIHDLGDRQRESVVLSNLGALLIEMEDFQASRDVLERTLILERSLDDVRSIGFCLTNLAEVHFRLGDLEAPLPMLAESTRSFLESNNHHDAALSQTLWARILLARGEIPAAIALAREALVTISGSGDLAAFAEAAELLARAALHLAALDEARALLHGTSILRAQVSSPTRPSMVAEVNAAFDAVRAALGPHALPDLTQCDLERPSDEIANEAIRLATALLQQVTASTSTPIFGMLPSSAPVPTPHASSGLATAEHPTHTLSDREMEVLRLLADGESTREIAEHLFIAPRTAATHVNNIIGKLGVSSRTAAVALAMRLGIV